jgi:hypothetical protein
MADADEDVVSEIVQRGRNLLADELVALIERRDATEDPGVSRETLDAYADALTDRPNFDIDTEKFSGAIDERLTDAERWAGTDALYDLDSRISAYPPAWHEEFGGSTDIKAYLALVEEASTGGSEESPDAGTSEGVWEEWLLDTVATIGCVERDEAKEALEATRAEGQIDEGPRPTPRRGRKTRGGKRMRGASPVGEER